VLDDLKPYAEHGMPSTSRRRQRLRAARRTAGETIETERAEVEPDQPLQDLRGAVVQSACRSRGHANDPSGLVAAVTAESTAPRVRRARATVALPRQRLIAIPRHIDISGRRARSWRRQGCAYGRPRSTWRARALGDRARPLSGSRQSRHLVTGALDLVDRHGEQRRPVLILGRLSARCSLRAGPSCHPGRRPWGDRDA
jgi:hypothetical protein